MDKNNVKNVKNVVTSMDETTERSPVRLVVEPRHTRGSLVHDVGSFYCGGEVYGVAARVIISNSGP